MEENLDKTSIMRNGPIKKTLLVLAVPSMIGMLASAFYNLVDTMFIGLLHDTNSMAAVSVTFPIFIILMAIGQMIGVGAASCVGRLLGAKEKEKADRASGLAIFLSVLFSVLAMVIGLIFLNPLLGLMGASGEVIPYAKSYASWLLLGSIFTITNLVFNNLLRTEGAAKRSMVTIIIGSVANIILDPIFMWVFNLGLSGAAIATVISQGISTVLMMSFYFKKQSVININKKTIFIKTAEDKAICKQIFSIGIPVFITHAFAAVATSVLNSAAEIFGAAALAAMGIVNKIYTILTQIIGGYANAYLPFSSYNIGAKKYSRVKEATYFSLFITFAYSFIAMAIINIMPYGFIRIFSNDPQVINLGINSLKMQTYLLWGFSFIAIMTALFQSMGDSKKAGVLSIARQGIILIPVTIFLPKIFMNGIPAFLEKLGSYPMEPGLYGVMLAQPLADLLTLFLCTCLCIKTFKTLSHLSKEEHRAHIK